MPKEKEYNFSININIKPYFSSIGICPEDAIAKAEEDISRLLSNLSAVVSEVKILSIKATNKE